MRSIVKIFVAAIVAAGMACVLIMYGASDNVVLSVYFFGAVIVAAVLGAFDIPAKSKHMTIKDGARSYDQAA